MGAPGDRRPLTILICGFGPFPGVPRNPAQGVALGVARLRRPALAHMRREVEILPTAWSALPHLAQRLARLQPDAVLLFGVAARRRVLAVEVLAVNAAGRAPDAARCHAPGRRLQASGPASLATTASAMRLVAALRQGGVKAMLSRDAGRYLCNAAYYTALSALRESAGRVPVVFVHLPGTRMNAFRLHHALGGLLQVLAGAGFRPNPEDPFGIQGFEISGATRLERPPLGTG